MGRSAFNFLLVRGQWEYTPNHFLVTLTSGETTNGCAKRGQTLHAGKHFACEG
jgi:hypothetical protein